MVRHQCLIYESSPAKQLAALAALAAEELRSNVQCLFLNSPAMVAGFRSSLAATGVDVTQAVQNRCLIVSSDQTHLSDGVFNPQRMLALLRHASQQALADGFKGLWATGDISWELGGERNFGKLLEYELGLEELLRENPSVSGICQYHSDTLPDKALAAAVYTHNAICYNDTIARLNSHFHRPETLLDGVPGKDESRIRRMLDGLGPPLRSH